MDPPFPTLITFAILLALPITLVLPIPIALLPAHALSAALGRLYRAKVFSVGPAWSGQLAADPAAAGDPGLEPAGRRRGSLGSAPSVAVAGLVVDPLFFDRSRRRLPADADSRPSTLLLLLVLRCPDSVGWLFNHVMQRWRSFGPVRLIFMMKSLRPFG